MSNTYLLQLTQRDLGQILEGLRAREESFGVRQPNTWLRVITFLTIPLPQRNAVASATP